MAAGGTTTSWGARVGRGRIPAGVVFGLLAACVAMALASPSPAATLPTVALPASAGGDTALPAPIAAGDSAANIRLNGAAKWVVVRWVARFTGTLSVLHLRIQADGSTCRKSGRTGYGGGNGGRWHVTTHPVLPDGRPDMSRTLATQDLRPCASSWMVDVRQGVVRLPMGISVVRAQEYATVIRNADANPSRNYTSTNFLYTSAGLEGANGHNARSPETTDAYYGLDPRELVGYSVDGGRGWALPGGPYGHPKGRNFLPTYVQQFSDGRLAGQPYYYAAAPSTAPRTMIFAGVVRPWTIRELGAFSQRGGRGTLTLAVDGAVRSQVPVSGAGMLRASILPTVVQPGQTVTVSASGLSIQSLAADTTWGLLMGMNLATSPWHLQGETNFSRAAPVYALPACASSCAAAW
ncbi:MAG: hypothetical protein QOK25_1764 [Thermoleophilaceae bacterium]|nr:hypothetical protein [Thermoleophilaceae bacterium]